MTEIMPVPRNLILLSYQQGALAVLFSYIAPPSCCPLQLLIVPPLIVNTQSFPISTAPPSPSSSLQFAMILLSKISVPLDTEKPQFLFWPSMVPSVPLSFIVSVLPSYTQNISSSVALQVKVYPFKSNVTAPLIVISPLIVTLPPK